ncbi:MAG: AraC family transcriptional regulator [Alphaproteobacteria bacterium]|nr:AraC family transcriptional regulator [Alphaproteobacteria bacterium]
MAHISTLFVHKLADLFGSQADAEGLALRRKIFAAAGVGQGDSDEPPKTIAASTFFETLERLTQEAPDGRSAGVRLGAIMRCDDYGPFGLAFKSAPDLLGSFSRVERYGRVVTSVANYTVDQRPAGTFMAITPGDNTRLGQRMTNELAIAAGTALCREVSQHPFSPKAVYFSHERPADLSAFTAHFECPLHFGADRDGFEIADAELRAGNRLGDDGLARFFDTVLDKELAEFVDETRLDQKVCSEISRALSQGVPVISEVAARLGMSGRTLQRRLAEDGHVYQDLVEITRRKLAERLLTQTDFAIAEIAFLTGYSEQSTFSRAFKRLSGQTPASFRRQDMLN